MRELCREDYTFDGPSVIYPGTSVRTCTCSVPTPGVPTATQKRLSVAQEIFTKMFVLFLLFLGFYNYLLRKKIVCKPSQEDKSVEVSRNSRVSAEK